MVENATYLGFALLLIIEVDQLTVVQVEVCLRHVELDQPLLINIHFEGFDGH